MTPADALVLIGELVRTVEDLRDATIDFIDATHGLLEEDRGLPREIEQEILAARDRGHRALARYRGDP